MVESTLKNEIVVDAVKFTLEKCKAGFYISSLNLENSQKLKSPEIFEGFSEEFASTCFQKLEIATKEKYLISLKVQPYKEAINLTGEKCAAVELGYPVTWSSYWDGNHCNPRLDSRGIHTGGGGAWSAASNDKNQWIQVSALEPKYWTGITIQGRDDCDQRVTKFTVKSSMGSKWEDIEEGREFNGCPDNKSKIHIEFKSPVLARTIRICPTDWNGHISVRFEAYFLSN